MTGALTIALAALLASAPPTPASLEARIEAAVRERTPLPAEAVVDVRVDTQRGECAGAIILPRGEDGQGRIVARAGRRGWVTASVTVLVPTVVAAQSIARGQRLDATDLAVALRERGRGTALVSREEAIGRVTRRPLTAGAALARAHLVRERLVLPRQVVQALVKTGALAVVAPAEARQGGALGDRIRVRIGPTGRDVDAIVVGPGRVEVQI